MKARIGILGLVVWLLAGPALAAAPASACSPCCAHAVHGPCGEDARSCASLSAAPCCSQAPVAASSETRRSLDPPGLRLAPPALQVAAAPPVWVARIPAEVDARTSPLRLSVVLRI